MFLNQMLQSLADSFSAISAGFVGFLPNFLSALVIFIIGCVVASFIKKLIAHLIKAIKLDSLLATAQIDSLLKRADLNLDSGKFLGTLVQWFVVIVFLIASLNVLGLTQVNEFLLAVVVSYLPRVIVAVLMLIVGVLVADFMGKVVVGGAKASNVAQANLLGSLTRWSIWIFALLVALQQVGIAGQLIQTIFLGLVVAISLAVGLAFGLGGQEAAAKAIDRIRQEIASRK
jgi:Conserved TM helix